MKSVFNLVIMGAFLSFGSICYKYKTVNNYRSDLQSPKFENSHFYQTYLKSNDSILLINLWATWCGPCIKEMPLLNKVKAQYSQWPVAFISLSLENDLNKVDKFLEKKVFDFKDISRDNMAYRIQIYNFLNQRPLEKPAGTTTIPMTFVIKNKKVVANITGRLEEGEINEILDEVLID